MIRNVVRAVTALLAALAVPAAMFVAPLPASANTTIPNVSVRETFGHNFCLGSDNLDSFTAVVERDCPGRKFNVEFTDTGFVKLRFRSSTSQCVAASNNFQNVVIHPCDGANVDWITDTSTGHTRFINRQAGTLLSGHNRLNSQFFMDCAGCTSGELQNFDLAT